MSKKVSERLRIRLGTCVIAKDSVFKTIVPNASFFPYHFLLQVDLFEAASIGEQFQSAGLW